MNPVSDDAAEPSSQFGRLAQKLEMFPRRNEGFLRDVLALAEIANSAVSQRANQCLVSRHDVAEGVAIAGQAARDKLRIALFLCGHRSVDHHTAGYVPAIVEQVTKNITALAEGTLD